VAGTNTITLPANTGTVITTASSGQVIPTSALPKGAVLQVVQGSVSTGASTTSTSDTATGLSVSITPTSSTSKILVLFSGNTASAGTGGYWGSISIYKNGTTRLIGGQAGTSTGSSAVVQSSLCYLDSPATTSATTYALYFRSEGNSSTVYLNSPTAVVLTSIATITAMEIAA
jgi:hypothetical protein